MNFSKLAQYWEKLEGEASRNKITEILAEVLREAGAEEVDKVCYLSLGRLGPLFASEEFNLAEKMMIRAVAIAYEVSNTDTKKAYKQKGDLGLVVEEFVIRNLEFEARNLERKNLKNLARARKVKKEEKEGEKEIMDVDEVYKKLLEIASEEGKGSQERKLQGMARLLRELDPISAKYVVRIPLKRMRLGFSDKTVLDALSFMERGDKSGKKELEEAYKVRPDIGILARVVKRNGIVGVNKLKEPQAGVPILMAKAQRLSSAEEILLKIGECAVEPKIDGFRLQCHYMAKQKTKNKKQKTGVKNKKINDNGTIEQLGNGKVMLFTRNLDDVTYMYPDIVKAVRKQIKAESAIFEGEAVAFDPETKEYLPFQETVQRKRKYEIKRFAKEMPLALIAFDCLYLNGNSLLNRPYKERRRSLERIIGINGHIAKKETQVRGKVGNSERTILTAEARIVRTEEELERLFEQAVGRGLEGVMAKRLDAPYRAGARNWNWIKYKRSYSRELTDTLDCVIMGYDYGKGKRTKFGIGGFLVGVYDEQSEVFRTVSKVGTGLSDTQWRKLRARGLKFKTQGKPKKYDANKGVAPDVWMEPEIVVEIEADEITKSPAHTAGLALRFPRLKRFRDDKRPEQATTIKELEDMYFRQRGRS